MRRSDAGDGSLSCEDSLKVELCQRMLCVGVLARVECDVLSMMEG